MHEMRFTRGNPVRGLGFTKQDGTVAVGGSQMGKIKSYTKAGVKSVSLAE